MSGRRLVVEADGGSRGNPGPAGFGALVRDAATGELLAEVAEAIGVATNNVAEYSGLIAGLRAAAAIDPECTVEVRMDSKLVVEQMSGRWQIKHSDMRALAAKARQALPPQRVRYTWVPRDRNKDADRLANEAMDAAARGGGAGSPASTRAPRPAPDTGEPTTLLLVRHGRTAMTEARQFSGSSDPDLSPAGREDAARVAALLNKLGSPDSPLSDVARPSVILTSPLRRTRQTAGAVAEATGLVPLPVDGWVEASFGEWEGLTYAEILKGWPEALAAVQGSATAAPPGGESLDVVRRRVGRTWRAAVQGHPDRTVVVVSHVTPIRCVLADALDAADAALWRIRVGPCSLSAVRFWADGNAEVLAVNLGAR